MRHEYSEEEHRTCAESLGVDSMPPMFTEILLDARAKKLPPEPVVVARFPELTREQFIESQKKQAPPPPCGPKEVYLTCTEYFAAKKLGFPGLDGYVVHMVRDADKEQTK